ncbi:MAG: ribosome maturation factor RimP [Selenomonadaceae bacterium]|nr:ribosome maturation factor RimP [Selenomonadaceae bacterium]
MPGKIETRVEELMKKILDDTEFELVDTEFVKEKDWYLRVFVDKMGGIDLDDCQLLSERLGNLLDDELVIDGPYILEVSSPGLDRVLKKDKDFLREAGKAVDVTLYAPIDDTKNFTGTLERRDKDFLYLKEFEPIPREKISQVRLHIEF